MTERRFPSPWIVEEQDACFVVRDHNGHRCGQTAARRISANTGNSY
jgi:hypothetical protein